MIRRRDLMLGGVALVGGRTAFAAIPIPRGNKLAFRLMRHGSAIGTHTLAFRTSGDTLEVEIAVEVLVKFGPIPFVRYNHHNRETWQGERLVGLNSRTDRNGKKLQMHAGWTSAGLAVEGSGTKPYIAPPNAFGSTYWHPRTLYGPLIGTQDGELMRPVVTQLGPEPVRLASGEQTPVKRCVLTGGIDAELWYDTTDTWAGMRFTVDDGSVVSYERL
jgi:hypothetical protein